MEKDTRPIISETGAEVFAAASKYADEDYEQTQKILKGEKDMTVFKMQADFHPLTDQLYFFLFLDFKGAVLSKKAVYIEQGIDPFEISRGFKENLSLLAEAEKKGFCHEAKTALAEKKLEKILSPQWFPRMISEQGRDLLDEIQLDLEKDLFFVFNRGLVLRLDLEKVNALEYHRFFFGEISREEKQLKEARKRMEPDPVFDAFKDRLKREGYRIFNAGYELSPVKGKNLEDFKPGDGIMVNLTPFSSEEKKILQGLGLVSPQGEIRPAKSRILAVSRTEDGFQCLSEIAPLLAVETPRAEELKVEGFSDAREEEEKAPRPGMVAGILLAAAGILILLAVFTLS